MENSNKIIKAIKQNQPKFDNIKNISEKILQVRKEQEEQTEFIKKVYDIVFKNLSSKKKIVKIDSKEYSISNTGISIKDNYGTNARNIKENDFLKSLIVVKENLPAFLKFLSPNKKIKLKKFIEKSNLLEEKSPISIPIKEKIILDDEVKNVYKIEISYFYSRISILFNDDRWSTEVNLINFDYRGYAIIEQIYNQFKQILEMELNQNEKELENMKLFLVDIDEKFGSYIQSVETLNELRKGD